MSCQALLLAFLVDFQPICDDGLSQQHQPKTQGESGAWLGGAAKTRYLSSTFLSNPNPTGGASERPPKIPWGREQAASNFSGPAGSVTGEVLAHFRRGGRKGVLAVIHLMRGTSNRTQDWISSITFSPNVL